MKIPSYPILITGASGWIGMNLLHLLQKKISKRVFNEKVICFGSKKSFINSTGYINLEIKIPVYPLSAIKEFINVHEKILIFHTAFLTPDKIDEYGKENFYELNNQISSLITDLLKNKREAKIVSFSSGAANIDNLRKYKKEKINTLIYGELKKKEEDAIKRYCSNYLILRVYSLTGKFIRNPDLYAFSKFIKKAILKERIVVNAPNKVVRGYCSIEDLARVSLHWMFSENKNKKEIISTISNQISISELANLISLKYNLPVPDINLNNKLPVDNYFDNSEDFLRLLKRFKIKPTNFEQQIEITYKWILYLIMKKDSIL